MKISTANAALEKTGIANSVCPLKCHAITAMADKARNGSSKATLEVVRDAGMWSIVLEPIRCTSRSIRYAADRRLNPRDSRPSQAESSMDRRKGEKISLPRPMRGWLR